MKWHCTHIFTENSGEQIELLSFQGGMFTKQQWERNRNPEFMASRELQAFIRKGGGVYPLESMQINPNLPEKVTNN